MNLLDAFAGIGGLSRGLEQAGMTLVGQIEIDPFCRLVLEKHWPDVPRHDDIRTAVSWWSSIVRPTVDILSGGFPCQPESLAGRRGGEIDSRWLWPYMAALIEEIRPKVVIVENVLGHRTGGLRIVLRDLARLGYWASVGTIRACEVGASHSRARLFTLAYSDGFHGSARLGSRSWGPIFTGCRAEGTWPYTVDGLETIARVHRGADGVSGRLDGNRIKGLGNAVVPQVAEHIGRIVMSGLRQAG